MTTDPRWADAQVHEAEYWGDCLGMRAWGEFTKQEMYGREMGLFEEFGEGMNGELDMRRCSVLDIGGGPVSMTLRCINASELVVADPLTWPQSALRRYANYGIKFIQSPAEELPDVGTFDEVWMYNVLQHVDDPQLVMHNIKHLITPTGTLRVFEWLNIPADSCHPHVLTPNLLLNGFAGLRILDVRIPRLNEYWSNADAFVGVFTE